MERERERVTFGGMIDGKALYRNKIDGRSILFE